MSDEVRATDRYRTIGRVNVSMVDGFKWEMPIRYEDFTTTNGGYRAVRDQVVEVLGNLYEDWRDPPTASNDTTEGGGE